MNNITTHTRTRSEYRDSLAAITASPLDDALRLVFADWLDEQGDADRAAYTRMEIVRTPARQRQIRRSLQNQEEYPCVCVNPGVP